ncbi:MAG: flavodoxin [Blautia sp.]|nr:flavodoxin [Blautia sp.]
MNGIILYKSKYGATKRYADWLAERTGFFCMKTEEADIKKLSDYDVILLGGGIYASSIAGLSFLNMNIDKLKDKKIIIFCCGASPYEQGAFEAIVSHNLKGDLAGIPCFYLRGAFDMGVMTWKDRTLCRMLHKALAKKNPDTYEVWEKALVEAFESEKADWTDKAAIEPIIAAI